MDWSTVEATIAKDDVNYSTPRIGMAMVVIERLITNDQLSLLQRLQC